MNKEPIQPPETPKLAGVDSFLNPQSMLTPGVMGSAVMLGANSLAQFHLTSVLSLYLLLSMVFGLTAVIKSESLVQKLIYYLLNSVIIFSVAVGANQTGQTAAHASLGLTSNAYASTYSSLHNVQQIQFFQNIFPTDTRYSKDKCGLIYDSNTNLEWFVGPDQDTSWDEAQSWISKLRACGHAWEFPTIIQLATILDRKATAGTGWFERGQNWPAHINPIFAAIGGGSWVWAKGKPDGAEYFTAFNYNQGIEVRISSDRKGVRVFAVRSTT